MTTTAKHPAMEALRQEIKAEVERLGAAYKLDAQDGSFRASLPLFVSERDRDRISAGVILLVRLDQLRPATNEDLIHAVGLVREAQKWLDDPEYNGTVVQHRDSVAVKAGTYRQQLDRLLCLLEEYGRVVKLHPEWCDMAVFEDIGGRYGEVVKSAGISSDAGKDRVEAVAVKKTIYKHLPWLYPLSDSRTPAKHLLRDLRQAIAAGKRPKLVPWTRKLLL